MAVMRGPRVPPEWLAAAVACALVGCAPVRRALVSPADYDAYRSYRLADDGGERLRAAWRYLREHGDGAFTGEVLRWFGPTEARFFAEAGRTPGGAAAYLALMPDGPHAEEERTFLRAFEREKIEGPARETKMLAAARLAAESARRAMGEALEAWARRAVRLTTWGEPLERLRQVDAAFAGSLDEQPAARCDPSGCVKNLYFTYAVPEASPAADRVVPLVVRLELSASVVSAVEIVAPQGGFTWWMEGTEARGVDPFDPAEREGAIVRAKNRIESIAREGAPGATCATIEAPTERTLDCGRVRVTIVARPNGDDVVRVAGLAPGGAGPAASGSAGIPGAQPPP